MNSPLAFLLAALLCKGLAIEDLATAKSALDDAFAKDGSVRDAIGRKFAHGEYDKVADTLMAIYDEGPAKMALTETGPADLAGPQWNDTWYEVPRDEIAVADGLDVGTWLLEQEWRYFDSPVGRPGSRTITDVSLAYATVRGGTGAKGAIVISPGTGESARNYDEEAYNLVSMGYSPIYVYAHRGQGESDRLIDAHHLQYVEDSQDYVHDLRHFTGLVAAEMAGNDDDKDKPLYMVCHSLGCGIAFSYFIEEYNAQRQLRYYGVAAVSPGLIVDTAPIPLSVAISLVNMYTYLGRGKSVAPFTERTWEQMMGTENFMGELLGKSGRAALTHSFSRYKRDKELCQTFRDEKLGAKNHSGLCIYGFTTNFLKEYFDMYLYTIHTFMSSEVKALELPILMLTGGDPDGSDGLVDNSKSVAFCRNSSVDCVHSNYRNAGHSLWSEKDSIRNVFLAEIDGFFQNHTSLVVQNHTSLVVRERQRLFLSSGLPHHRAPVVLAFLAAVVVLGVF